MPAIRAAFNRLDGLSIRETRAKGDEDRLVKDALAEGFSTIVAAGGDGTWSNVGRAILKEGAGTKVSLGLIAAGTGNDLAKSIGAPAGDYEATARLVEAGKTTLIDAGKVGSDFFLNSIGFGFDASVLATIEKMSWLRGSAVYTVAALRQLFTYRGFLVSSPDAKIPEKPMMMIVANGGYLGGAFRIAPSATITDGTLDTVIIADMPALDRLRLFGAAMQGSHIGHAAVTTVRSTRITLEFAEPPSCQRDGELDHLPDRIVSLSCAPAALKVIA